MSVFVLEVSTLRQLPKSEASLGAGDKTKHPSFFHFVFCLFRISNYLDLLHVLLTIDVIADLLIQRHVSGPPPDGLQNGNSNAKFLRSYWFDGDSNEISHHQDVCVHCKFLNCFFWEECHFG